MRRQPLSALQLPVQPTFDLTHVSPTHFSAALGNDPTRIFEFVRDNIAFEAYAGLLRGPRGTLLAMAGNSVDRAALLGALLQNAGQGVRYARGTLSEREAREMVASMWAEPAPPAPSSTASPLESAPAHASFESLKTSIERDLEIILGQLKGTRRPERSSIPTFEALVREARSHYWVQWRKDGGWVDLDPSTRDSTPGRALAKPEEILQTMPDQLFHTLTIRIRVEEYAGATPAVRTILAHSMRAAELSGRDLLLTHLPEKWSGSGLASGIKGAIENTGRVKPVLFVGDQPIEGAAFAQRIKTEGIGSIPNLLGGAGTREAVPLVTAEWLEFEFISPDGSRRTITRELFDLVGPARRTTGQALTPEEVQARTTDEKAFDVAFAVYDLFFTTGKIDAEHAAMLGRTPPKEANLTYLLLQTSLAFTTISDAILGRLKAPSGAIIVTYPDAPRVVITEMSIHQAVPRLVIDLRHFRGRSVGVGVKGDEVLGAQIFAGVVHGVVERVVVELITLRARERTGAGPVVSTSAVFERAQAEAASALLLPRDDRKLDSSISPDAVARLRESLSEGNVAVAPQRAIVLGSAPRFAWWRIDLRSGETTAVTDEGLHATATENVEVTVERSETQTRVTVTQYVGPQGQTITYSFQGGVQEMARDVRILESAASRSGWTVRNIYTGPNVHGFPMTILGP